MVTITDRRIQVPNNANTDVDHYEADVSSAQDFFSGGMEMPGRTYNANSSTYGFNGKRKDNDIYGEGNAYDFGDRIYDPRIVTWLSTDPLQAKYPGITPYSFVANNPINLLDPDGRDIINQLDTHKSQYEAQIKTLKSLTIFNKIYSQFESSTRHYYIYEGNMADAISSASASYESSPMYNKYSLGLSGNFPYVIKSNSTFDGRIYINTQNTKLESSSIYEEVFHGFQAVFYGVDKNGQTKANVVQQETEARVARFFEGQYTSSEKDYYGDYINDKSVIAYYSALRNHNKKEIKKNTAGFRAAVSNLAETTARLYINSTDDSNRKRILVDDNNSYKSGATPAFDSLTLPK